MIIFTTIVTIILIIIPIVITILLLNFLLFFLFFCINEYTGNRLRSKSPKTPGGKGNWKVSPETLLG